VANLDTASVQVRQVITDLTGPDDGGTTATATIRESLSNMNVAATNMADGTEALKHNFLLRSFFRSRGYYSLANISPDLDRKDCLFASQNADRAWLAADPVVPPDLGWCGRTQSSREIRFQHSPGGTRKLWKMNDPSGSTSKVVL
jgi:hypothetical protein